MSFWYAYIYGECCTCRHGIFQKLSGWADGPEYVTQCPIVPGNSYTYKFKITGQEGTLWWHAHSSWLRATVHGALIIRPKSGHSYPFPKPHKEVPILFGIPSPHNSLSYIDLNDKMAKKEMVLGHLNKLKFCGCRRVVEC